MLEHFIRMSSNCGDRERERNSRPPKPKTSRAGLKTAPEPETARQELTPAQRRLQKRFLLYRFLKGAWLINAIWLYSYRLFMNDAGAGLIGTITILVGLFAEIPSRALADKFGHGRVAKVGLVITAVGIAGMALSGFAYILIFNLFFFIGIALTSGADEALFYEKLISRAPANIGANCKFVAVKPRKSRASPRLWSAREFTTFRRSWFLFGMV